MRHYLCMSFGSGTDGELPVAGVIDVKGTLYGTTYNRGAGISEYCNGCGTVFSVKPKTGT